MTHSALASENTGETVLPHLHTIQYLVNSESLMKANLIGVVVAPNALIGLNESVLTVRLLRCLHCLGLSGITRIHPCASNADAQAALVYANSQPNGLWEEHLYVSPVLGLLRIIGDAQPIKVSKANNANIRMASFLHTIKVIVPNFQPKALHGGSSELSFLIHRITIIFSLCPYLVLRIVQSVILNRNTVLRHCNWSWRGAG
jgi:hypothetical protein